MKIVPLLAGIALAFGAAWGGLWAVRAQMESLRPARLSGGGFYPVAASEAVVRGARLYGQLGCASCHTQQLSPFDVTAPTARGWGARRTVARDYLGAPDFLGTRRLGPDLANVGVRRPDPAWHRDHLADPRALVPDSLMPSFAFLSERDRDDLAAYLASLDRSAPLPEAPLPKK
jgi:cytochrome c oxidase cbb3-type subunit 2